METAKEQLELKPGRYIGDDQCRTKNCARMQKEVAWVSMTDGEQNSWA